MLSFRDRLRALGEPVARLLVGLSALLIGCQRQDAATPEDGKTAAAVAGEKSGADVLAPADTWEADFMANAKMGYGHNVRRQITEGGRRLWQTDGQERIKLARLGQTIELNIDVTSVDDLDGALVHFESRVNLGPVPMVARGQVKGDKLDLELTTEGKTTHTMIPWPAGTRGFFAAEQSLERKAMQPGEVRHLQTFLPVINQVADLTLTAGKFGPTKMLEGKHRKLLRIATASQLPGQAPLLGAVWTDERGQTWKSREEAMDQESFRASRQQALREADGPAPDLMGASIIKVDVGAMQPHDVPQMVYDVTLKDGDPVKVFPASASQGVKRIGPHEAEITVRAIRPGDGHARGKAKGPTDADRTPNNMIQSDDATVVAMAKEGAGKETDAWRTAVALERYVRTAMRESDFSQALASAAEVARTRRGDCTEYAVLLAGLARARGIPARVAVGLVYSPALDGFGYHMWTEMWIDGEWIPLDATLGRGGIGGGHLKLADTNLSAGGLGAFLPVNQVFGKLAIKVAKPQSGSGN